MSYRGSTPRNGMGTASLVMGILQFCCLPIVGAVLAVAFGKAGIDRARRGEATNLGVAQAGFWLGWAGLALTLVGFVIGFFSPYLVWGFLEQDQNVQTGLADGTYVMYPDEWTYIAGRCAGDGPVYGIRSDELVARSVEVFGEGPTQCGGLRHPSQVMFTVTGGVATINTVAR